MDKFETALLVIFITAIILFFVWYFRTKEYTYAIDKMWMDGPKAAFHDVSSILGAPDLIVPGAQSSALWYKKNLLKQKIPFEKVMVVNDLSFGACSNPHPANVKISLKVNINDTAYLLCILGGSLGFSYDAASQTLAVRCFSFGTAIAHVLFALNIIGKSPADAFSSYLDGSYKEQMKGLYSDIDNLSGAAYKNKVQEYMAAIGQMLPVFTPPTLSPGPDCVYPLDSDSVRALVAGTSLCTPAAKAKLPLKENFVETTYRQLTIPCDGKVYNLGLPRNFVDCNVEKKRCEKNMMDAFASKACNTL